ncbi:5-(carboxyamino)imidazole ribonucleotide synthase [Fructilactobacillus sp. Tb1]|uniref:5-(carboxyamino)imidazole ribonucleotide synthase n=1 Tax=Fructilactobacillus sp. Tb1 TaxID=3422304 RepID=UPI003D2D7285
MKNKVIVPPATIGIIGGGQLGRMMAEAAKPMGYTVIILDPNPDSSAGKVSDAQIVADYDDRAALKELAEKSDVVTYEFENVDLDGIETIKSLTAIPQNSNILKTTSNRILEKNFLKNLNIPVAPFAEIKSIEDLKLQSEKLGYPLILKTTTGGYDGHGQWDINNATDIENLPIEIKPQDPLILEKKINFDEEASMMVTVDGKQQIVTWPISINYHQDHILKISVVDDQANQKLTAKAKVIAEKIAKALDLKGMFGIEFFVTDDELYVNELAPRPHNSGHYSIEGSNTSQFAGQIRSVTGLPIEDIQANNDFVTMINLLGDEISMARQDLPNHPEWHFHDYEKTPIKPKRKMGHITVLGKENGNKLIAWEKSHHE